MFLTSGHSFLFHLFVLVSWNPQTFELFQCFSKDILMPVIWSYSRVTSLWYAGFQLKVSVFDFFSSVLIFVAVL